MVWYEKLDKALTHERELFHELRTLEDSARVSNPARIGGHTGKQSDLGDVLLGIENQRQSIMIQLDRSLAEIRAAIASAEKDIKNNHFELRR